MPKDKDQPHYGEYATVLLDAKERKAVAKALNTRVTRPTKKASEIIIKINAN